MADYTFPNQRVIKINREAAKSDFLGIKNENWQAAARDLGAHATMLYLYLAANADGYNLALSPVAVRQAIGMARSTYHDQFHKLVDRGYLVPSHGNTYEFYEVPQAATQARNELSDNGYDFEESPTCDTQETCGGQSVLAEDTEINNRDIETNNTETNIENEEAVIIQKPRVREITIKPPTAEGRKRPKPMEQIRKAAFEF